MAEEEQGEPGLESVNRNDEQDPDNPALLRRVRVVPGGHEMHNEDFQRKICRTVILLVDGYLRYW